MIILQSLDIPQDAFKQPKAWVLLTAEVIHQKFVVQLSGLNDGLGRCDKSPAGNDPHLLGRIYQDVVSIDVGHNDSLVATHQVSAKQVATDQFAPLGVQMYEVLCLFNRGERVRLIEVIGRHEPALVLIDDGVLYRCLL